MARRRSRGSWRRGTGHGRGSPCARPSRPSLALSESMPWHTIKPGEWMRQIANDHGFTDWEAIFQLPENQPLRDAKRDPNQLLPGESVFLPDRRRKTAEVAAGATHKFVAKQPAQQISIQVHDEQGKPLKTRPYKV